MKERTAKNCIRVLEAGAVLLTALVCLKSVWVSLDIDESYGAAMAWRLAGILIHTALGLALYGELRRDCPKPVRLLLLFLHLNFYPKFIVSPEFELMHYWFCLGIFLLLHAYFGGGRPGRLLALGAGVCLTGSMTCYPTMILTYPVYLLGIWAVETDFLKILIPEDKKGL